MVDPEVLSEAIPRIVRAGLAALPREAVGLLCPDGSIFFLTNEATDSGSYDVSGAQLQTAFLDEEGVESLGFGLLDVVVWHTHPSGFAGPSKGDLEGRRQPILNDMAHLVVALPNGEACYY